jgi:hypothetical protein
MNWQRNLALVPHYVASLLLILLVIGGLRTFVGNFGIVVELPIVVALVLGYPTLVRWLGVAPAAWEE